MRTLPAPAEESMVVISSEYSKTKENNRNFHVLTNAFGVMISELMLLKHFLRK